MSELRKLIQTYLRIDNRAHQRDRTALMIFAEWVESGAPAPDRLPCTSIECGGLAEPGESYCSGCKWE